MNPSLKQESISPQSIRIERPTIFPDNVIMAGVTERNFDLFPETGFSLLKAQILNENGVEEHRKLFATTLGVERDNLCFQQQVHGNLARLVQDNDPRREPFIESDGLMTAQQGLVLCVGIADCAGVLLYDPKHRAIAGIHSGWRGTKENIVAEGIAQMGKLFGTTPASLLAYISPCASGERYVVREDVARYFTAPVVQRINAEEFSFDNRAEILRQLISSGIQAGNIEVAQGCTIADPRYHSHRRDGARAGRMVAFIGLKYISGISNY